MNLHPLKEDMESTIGKDHHLTVGILAHHLHHPDVGLLKVSDSKSAHYVSTR